MPLGRSLRLLARPTLLPPASTQLSLYRTMASTEHIEKKARTTEVCPNREPVGLELPLTEPFASDLADRHPQRNVPLRRGPRRAYTKRLRRAPPPVKADLDFPLALATV